MKTWLLYGANGYTGELIAREAKKRGISLTLAGRSEKKIRPLAKELGFNYKIFTLDEQKIIEENIEGFKSVLLVAGPFLFTAEPMLNACFKMGVHYLDISGEVSILDTIQKRAQEATKAGIVLLPAVGYDVVPTDCLSLTLKQALPDAIALDIFLPSASSISHGTRKTLLTYIHKASGYLVRKDGVLTVIDWAQGHPGQIVFSDGKEISGWRLPSWGDIVTAYYSTSIPNINVFSQGRPLPVKLLRLKPLNGFFHWINDTFLQGGPTTKERETQRPITYAKVTNQAGKVIIGSLETCEAYQLSALTALECAERVSRGDLPPGFYTPATAFGAHFIRVIGNSKMELCEGSQAPFKL